MVVLFHIFETYSKGPQYQIINHGYLAVDFFFVLSGFVVGYAYDDRWDRMTTWGFFKRRLTRLHPMVIAGTLIGAALFFISDSSLFFVRFNKDSRLKTHFLVMLTYSIGELLIVLGLL